MRTEVIQAETIDEAADKILKVLKEDTNATRSVSSRNNVFYFDGWDGLGASAVLRAIATATSPAVKSALAELDFDQDIHIDCSMWESRRVLQRTVAQQLNLRAEVMKMFDRQDEEDDYRGVAQGSRAELQEVVREMHQHIQKLNHRFLVIFHNGSSEEIDLASLCGFPLSGYSTNKVLWTFQGRFRLKPRTKIDRAMTSTGTTNVFISAVSGREGQYRQYHQRLWSDLVHQEASEVFAAYKINAGPHCIIDQRAQVADCFFYMLELCCSGRHSTDYDLASHCANYWACDGIIQRVQQGDRDIIGAAADADDSLWRAADALQREIQLDVDYHQYLSSHLARCAERKSYWTSPTYGVILIPSGDIPNGDMFQHFDKLSVLKISRCTFNFRSPPFICCHSLRFLWLDGCEDTGINTDGEGKEGDVSRCFQSLWVLGVHYMDCSHILSAQMLDFMTQMRELNVIGAYNWDMGQLKGRLPNIRKLRIKKSTVHCNCSEKDMFSEMNKMELLDFSGNDTFLMRTICNNNNSCLESVILDEVSRLKHISFRGCIKLKNLLLRGIIKEEHWTLDISGTAVKTLDLTGTEIFCLDELHLLGCENLCAITWPQIKDKKKEVGLSKLCIDTTQSAHVDQSREEDAKSGTDSIATSGTSEAAVVHYSLLTSEFPWNISVRDARLLTSLDAVYSDTRELYVEVSSPTSPNIDAGSCKVLVSLQRQTAPAIYAADCTLDHLQQVGEGNGDAPGIMWMWPCPDVPNLSEKSCYMHLLDQISPGAKEASDTITVPEFVLKCGKILHVHDSLSISTIPSHTSIGLTWQDLEWCKIERCPGVHCIFRTGLNSIYRLRTFWASQLLKVHRIWINDFLSTFPDLTVLHLHCCPRLIHVLHLSEETITGKMFLQVSDNLRQLKTLEITWCGDLEEVFPLDSEAKQYVEEKEKQRSQQATLDLPSLNHIHLHELPRLQHICEFKIYAPNLETVKIRGCWSLKRLPDVSGSNQVVECDCEKEWWDKLEWEHSWQVSRYKPIHSHYYKKTLLKGTVLR